MLFILLNTVLTIALQSFAGVPSGPSYGFSQLIPFAASKDNKVLCKTYYTVNEMGSYFKLNTVIGWLVIDEKGQQYRYTHIDIPDEIGVTGYNVTDSLEASKAEFDGSVNLSLPPQSLVAAINEHGPFYQIPDRMGENNVFWTNQGIQNGKDSLLTKPILQHSLMGLTNDSLPGTRVGCAYLIGNLAFFNNSSGFNEERDILIGASFFHDQYEFGLDYWEVTGYCVIPE